MTLGDMLQLMQVNSLDSSNFKEELAVWSQHVFLFVLTQDIYTQFSVCVMFLQVFARSYSGSHDIASMCTIKS